MPHDRAAVGARDSGHALTEDTGLKTLQAIRAVTRKLPHAMLKTSQPRDGRRVDALTEVACTINRSDGQEAKNLYYLHQKSLSTRLVTASVRHPFHGQSVQRSVLYQSRL
jgi:hypothetical protein